MLHFALGDHDSGRTRYQESLEIADSEKQPFLRQRIKMHWLHEEALSGTVTEAQSKHLVHQLESDSEVGTGVKEDDDYWNNMKAEILVNSAKSGELHNQQKDTPHVLEQYI